jgi:hypothetical protein
MPCRTDPDLFAEWVKQDADLATRLLCELCRRLKKMAGGEDLIALVSNGELGGWLLKHEAVDERRIRAEAIAKLTPEEIEALGLKESR